MELFDCPASSHATFPGEKDFVVPSSLVTAEHGPISPSTTEESGYRTRCGSSNPSINGDHIEIESSHFFPADRTVFLLDRLELEDDVFVDSSVSDMTMDHSQPERPVVAGVPGRGRAFSYPFTLSDVHFPVGSSALALRRHFFVKTTTLAVTDHGQMKEAAKEDDTESDIDDVDGVHAPSCSPSLADRMNNASPEDNIIREDYYGSPEVDDERYLDLPDLVRSGLHRTADMSQARLVRSSDMEFRIACRLAKIGDEFDLKYFNSSDTTDGGGLNFFNFDMISRVWSYFTKKSARGSSPDSDHSPRQRSYSTAD